jgi:energy-coupling factor transporter ATP-binding protein EcfA2
MEDQIKQDFLSKTDLSSGRSFQTLQDSMNSALAEYAFVKPISTGFPELDQVLGGGLEAGNFFLMLGPAKSGKSTILRCIGLKMAETNPVIYANVEQLSRTTSGKIFQMYYGEDFRVSAQGMDPIKAAHMRGKIYQMPSIPFYITAFEDSIGSKAFNGQVGKMLGEAVDAVENIHGVKPVVVLENLTNVYNERTGSKDNLTNIVSQTIDDIDTFCRMKQVAVVIAHHTPKILGDRPGLDDVRDSKRVTDLAHAIFCCYTKEAVDKGTGRVEFRDHRLAFLAGRESDEYKDWSVQVGRNAKMTLQ